MIILARVDASNISVPSRLFRLKTLLLWVSTLFATFAFLERLSKTVRLKAQLRRKGVRAQNGEPWATSTSFDNSTVHPKRHHVKMGNFCGKSANFEGEGRTLGGSAASNRPVSARRTNPTPTSTTPKPSTAPDQVRVLGGDGGGSGSVSSDARTAAREAAERRVSLATSSPCAVGPSTPRRLTDDCLCILEQGAEKFWGESGRETGGTAA